jgi:ParB-like chromosome segregation protein Spo0J
MAEKVMKVHPTCQMFGTIAPLSKDELAELTDDIKTHGIKVPILINKKRDTILDGLTRWKIAHDLKIKLPNDRFEIFKGKDEEIESEILSRNLFRRHMSDDQRVAVVTKLRRPQLEKEAKDRQSAAGAFKGDANLDGKGSVAEKIAKEAGVTSHKAKQAVKADKAGLTDDVIQGKTKLGKAAKKAGSKVRKPKKELPFEDQVYKKWTQFVGRFAPPLRRRVMDLIKGWIGNPNSVPKPDDKKEEKKK